jgi:hypothetical protein
MTVADVIDMTDKLPKKGNLITSHPMEFRRADWHGGHILMCTREESALYEAHRIEALRTPGHQHIAFVPNHDTLDGGYHFTVVGLYRFRGDESKMRRIYRLAGMMECVTNAPSPILRTDLLRRFYKSIIEERDELNMVWRGNVLHFLLPLAPQHYNPTIFLHRIANAESLKDLYAVIQAETDTQFDMLAQHYVFYLPEGLAS